ncbi:Transmembrane protein 234 like [Pseudolycoriella hygida]|uniref:Transmembrane protein 234 like n=1 Tax=Pseudolycoriella hygida TaxID=35572 RepID=A0A9Q0NBQ3_9DIPT|nr:Transmembrane protein 234 like [Pseudolycoriella hygida]
MFTNYLLLVAVAFLWGATNPLIRRGSAGVENIKSGTAIKQFVAEIIFLITRWQYLVPFLLNQCGSVLYVLTLQDTELSVAVPIANSLSFVFTAISALLLGEQRASLKNYIGMGLVMLGTTICVIAKMENKTTQTS